MKRAPAECFNEAIARLYSKAWSAAFLKKILTQRRKGAETPGRDNEEGWLCTVEDAGVAVVLGGGGAWNENGEALG